MRYNDPQEAFDDFWKDIVCDPAGFFDPDAVKKELYDYHFIMTEVGEVYSYITGGQLSKPNYYANVVKAKADEFQTQLIEDQFQDIYDIMKDASDLDEALDLFKHYTNVS